MNIVIVGSRSFSNYSFMKKCILNIIDVNIIDYIISGGAKGADSLAEVFAKDYNIRTMIFKPNWKKYGRAAGVIRNTDIINNADIVIAFPIGDSKGTYNSINKAKKADKKVYIFEERNKTVDTFLL